MKLPTLEDLNLAAKVVYQTMPPTPQYSWPLLNARTGSEVWVKHENHTPVGAFKIRGGLVYINALRTGPSRDQRCDRGDSRQFRPGSGLRGKAARTGGNDRGSHRQQPREEPGNAGAGRGPGGSRARISRLRAKPPLRWSGSGDFIASLRLVHRRARTGTFAMELFNGAPELDTVYVPIGLGSSICGVMAARDAMGLKTKIVGVVAKDAPAYACPSALASPFLIPPRLSLRMDWLAELLCRSRWS